MADPAALVPVDRVGRSCMVTAGRLSAASDTTGAAPGGAPWLFALGALLRLLGDVRLDRGQPRLRVLRDADRDGHVAGDAAGEGEREADRLTRDQRLAEVVELEERAFAGNQEDVRRGVDVDAEVGVAGRAGGRGARRRGSGRTSGAGRAERTGGTGRA